MISFTSGSGLSPFSLLHFLRQVGHPLTPWIGALFSRSSVPPLAIGMMWSTASDPGWPHRMQVSSSARTWARIRRLGLDASSFLLAKAGHLSLYPPAQAVLGCWGQGMRRVLLAALALALSCSACGSDPAQPANAAAPKASASSSARPGLTAKTLAKQLGKRFRMPNPRDNTAQNCGALKCLQLITTDTVSIYEFGGGAKAKAFAKGMGGAGGPAAQVGRFVLSWNGRRGKDLMTAKNRRAMALLTRRIGKLSAAAGQ